MASESSSGEHSTAKDDPAGKEKSGRKMHGADRVDHEHDETRRASSAATGGLDGKRRTDGSRSMLDGAYQASASMWRRSLPFSEEAARFAARRAERYREYFEDLACCQSPIEAGQATARAMEAAMTDYAEEFGRMGEIALSRVEDVEREAGLVAD
jgi:hypothetical protein